MPLVNKHKKRPETLKKSIPKKPLPYLFQAFQTLPVIEKKPFSLSICMPESGKSAHIVKNGTSGSIHPALYRYIPSTPRRTALNALCK